MEARLVYFFVFDGFVDYEASYALAAINTPIFQQNPGRYKIVTFGLTRNPVRSAGGLCILPDSSVQDLGAEQAALLILPGGTKWESGGNMEAVEVAKTILARGGAVAAICGATLGLARGGLLNERKHTSNAPEYLAASKYAGGGLYVDQGSVTDRGVITAGAVFPTDFAKEIARQLALYSAPVEAAWYGLIKTGDRKYFYELMQLMNKARAVSEKL